MQTGSDPRGSHTFVDYSQITGYAEVIPGELIAPLLPAFRRNGGGGAGGGGNFSAHDVRSSSEHNTFESFLAMGRSCDGTLSRGADPCVERSRRESSRVSTQSRNVRFFRKIEMSASMVFSKGVPR